MRIYSVNTCEYECDIGKLLTRQLVGPFAPELICSSEHTAKVSIPNDESFEVWCSAVAHLLIRDLSHFELARFVNALPLALSQKYLILPKALKTARIFEYELLCQECLAEYFSLESTLNLEGFLRFRMQALLERWAICVAHAAEELILAEETRELNRLFGILAALQTPHTGSVLLSLKPGGNCTLTDGEKLRIHCCGGYQAVIGILVSLAPERIAVFDHSCGESQTLCSTLHEIYADRVYFYLE